MTTQINLRLSDNMLDKAKEYSDMHGYSSIQDFIKETLREKLFEEPEITAEELELVKQLAVISEKKNLYGTEKELFDKLRRK